VKVQKRSNCGEKKGEEEFPYSQSENDSMAKVHGAKNFYKRGKRNLQGGEQILDRTLRGEKDGGGRHRRGNRPQSKMSGGGRGGCWNVGKGEGVIKKGFKTRSSKGKTPWKRELKKSTDIGERFDISKPWNQGKRKGKNAEFGSIKEKTDTSNLISEKGERGLFHPRFTSIADGGSDLGKGQNSTL